MRKMLAIITAVAAAASLTACSSGSAPAKTEAAKTEAAQTEAAKTEAAQTEAAKTEAAQTEAAGDTAEWPTGTVTVVVPAAAGSTIDLQARVVTTYLQNKTGAAFVVTNDTTGNGTVAYETVRNAKPDGSTLLWTQNLFIQSRGGIYNQEPWDAFDPVANCGDSIEQYILVARSGEEYTTWEELVEYAKAHPGELVAGIQNGGQAHMLQAMLGNQAGIECQMVEAGSSGDKITGILGGYIDIAFVSTQSGASYCEAGDLIALMTTTAEKSTFNAEWPTSAELGFPDVTVLTKTQVFVPKGMDDSLKNAINAAIVSAAEDAEAQEQLDKLVIAYPYGSVEDAVAAAEKSDELLQEGYKAIAE